MRLGDADASRAAVELLLSPEASLEERIAVARTLGEVRSADSVESLIRVSTAPEPPLQRAALAALSSFRDPGVGQQALAQFSDYSDQARPAFFDLMLSRPVWTRQLIQAVSRGGLAPELVPDDVAERLRGDQDRKIAGLAREHLGSGEELDREAVRRRITRLRSMLADGTGNPYAGEAAYTRRCGSCHKLFHKGGSSGPDLTAYQRGDLGTLLISIVDPDAEIREGYEYVTLVTKEGRTLSGFLTDRDPQVVVLRGMAGEDIRVERRQVESIEPMGRSLMARQAAGRTERSGAARLLRLSENLPTHQPLTIEIVRRWEKRAATRARHYDARVLTHGGSGLPPASDPGDRSGPEYQASLSSAVSR